MIHAAHKLQEAGADFLVIASNTMHKMADNIAQASNIHLLHIADPTGQSIGDRGFKTVGLLGTAFTMEQEFYRGRLQKKFDLTIIIPDQNHRSMVHTTIYNELVKGVISDSSRENFKSIIKALVAQGAEAVILGCTEIMLLLKDGDSPVPLFDTTTLHAQHAAQQALTLSPL